MAYRWVPLAVWPEQVLQGEGAGELQGRVQGRGAWGHFWDQLPLSKSPLSSAEVIPSGAKNLSISLAFASDCLCWDHVVALEDLAREFRVGFGSARLGIIERYW